MEVCRCHAIPDSFWDTYGCVEEAWSSAVPYLIAYALQRVIRQVNIEAQDLLDHRRVLVFCGLTCAIGFFDRISSKEQGMTKMLRCEWQERTQTWLSTTLDKILDNSAF